MLTIRAMSDGKGYSSRHLEHNDYYSEGDYWWPDPKNPGGPYARRDGETNPANFNGHREALIRFGVMAPALVAAWRRHQHRQRPSRPDCRR